MLEKVRMRLPGHGTVVAYLALFLTLTGGTAFALSGSNTVFSDDIKDGEVKGPDIRNGAVGNGDLAPNSVSGGKIANETVGSADIGPRAVRQSELAPPEDWRPVTFGPPPPPGSCTFRQAFADYGGGFSSAGFYRDPSGTVHMKGLIKLVGGQAPGVCFDAIFDLPAGYRPMERHLFTVLSNGVAARVDVSPSSRVEYISGGDPYQWLSLDGITFRCAPSGANGCP